MVFVGDAVEVVQVHALTPGLDFRECVLSGLFWGDVAVVGDSGCDAAGTDASGGEEGDPAVGGGFAGLDVEGGLEALEDAFGSFHVAGGAEADHAGVFALGFELEEVVEGGDAVDAAGGELEFGGDEPEDVVLEVSEEFLRLVEDLDECIVAELMLLHVDLEDLEAFVPAGMVDGGPRRRLHADNFGGVG